MNQSKRLLKDLGFKAEAPLRGHSPNSVDNHPAPFVRLIANTVMVAIISVYRYMTRDNFEHIAVLSCRTVQANVRDEPMFRTGLSCRSTELAVSAARRFKSDEIKSPKIIHIMGSK